MRVDLIGKLLERTILFNVHELQRATPLRRGQSTPPSRARQRLGFSNFDSFENSQNKTYNKIFGQHHR